MALCVLCGQEAEYNEDQLFDRYIHRVKCKSCGEFRWSRDVENYINGLAADKKVLLSGYMRERTVLKRTMTLSTEDDIQTIIQNCPTDLLDKLDHLLVNLVNITAHLGQNIHLKESDYPLGYVSGWEQFRRQIDFLRDQEYLKELPNVFGKQLRKYRVLIRGFERAREIQETYKEFSNQAFVAMSFSGALTPCWEEGIKRAIEDAGFDAIRVDRTEHNDRIDDRIIVEIKRSRFLVADLTGQNQGVYYEAGFAQGLGLPVIWTCRESDKEKVHLDIRQYNRIIWDQPGDLVEPLRDRILATIGSGKNFREK